MKHFLALAVLLGVAQFISAAIIGASPAQVPGSSAAGSSFSPTFSGNGRILIFVSHANNLVTNDDRGSSMDVFARDLVNSNTVLVSVSTNGVGGANADAQDPVISHNGQFVAFTSQASNLVSGDLNNASDVFVRDIINDTTKLVSAAITGGSPVNPTPTLNAPLSSSPMISADGRWVIFESRATNLTSEPAPLQSVNIYARDTWSNVTVAVSVTPQGALLGGLTALSSISTNGRFVAFNTTNNAAVAGVTNVTGDVYIRDLETATTRWVSSNLSSDSVYKCYPAVLSPNASYVAFGVSNRFLIHIHNLGDDAFTNVMAATFSAPGLRFSADSSHLLWSANGDAQLLNLLDGSSRTIGWPSCDCGGSRGPGYCVEAWSVSADARYVAHRVTSGEICAGWASTYAYRTDWQTGVSNVVVMVTTNGSWLAERAGWEGPIISPDGSLVAFDTTAADLVPADFNYSSDVFVRNMTNDTTVLISAAQRPASTPVRQSELTRDSISADGRYVVFVRDDDPSRFRDTNGFRDVFMSDLLMGTTRSLSLVTDLQTNQAGWVSYVDNTNIWSRPIISGNGSVVVALRRHDTGLNEGITQIGLMGRVAGTVGNGIFQRVDGPSLSDDGSLLGFQSVASTLPTFQYINDLNGTVDVFVLYQPGGNNSSSSSGDSGIIILSRATNGFQSGNQVSTNPAVSPDGRFVAFQTLASDIVPQVPGDIAYPPQPASQYSAKQLIVADLGSDRSSSNYLRLFTNRLASYTVVPNGDGGVVPEGEHPNTFLSPITNAVLTALWSRNSRYLFYSITNPVEIYRHDVLAVRTNWYSRYFDSNGNQELQLTNAVVPGVSNELVCSNCYNLSSSTNGSVVAFERPRAGTNLLDVYARDLNSGIETLVSVGIGGSAANGNSSQPQVNGDGRYLVFQSDASNLVANDLNRATDIFVRDRVLGITMLVSANAQGRSGNGPTSRPVMAANGRTVVFQSLANDLADNDYNDRRDIFVLTLGSADSDGDGMNDDWEVTYFGNLSHDGTSDSDGDGASDLAEFQAGTDPTNLNSAFRVLIVAPAGGASRQLIWSGNPARSYRAEYKDNVSAADWTPVSSAVSWNGSTASVVDFTATNSPQRYYRAVLLP